MNIKVNLEKAVFVCLLIFAAFSCRTINSVRASNSKYLEEYKSITRHIVDNNYHDGFNKNLVIERSEVSDSTLANFMIKRGINSIHIIGRIDVSEEYIAKYLPNHHDSTIMYQFGFVPVLGKKKELIFDFSSNPPSENYKKDGVMQVILEKGIYYNRY